MKWFDLKESDNPTANYPGYAIIFYSCIEKGKTVETLLQGQDGHTFGARHIMQAFESCLSLQDMFDNLDSQFKELHSQRKYYSNGQKDQVYLNLPIYRDKNYLNQSLKQSEQQQPLIHRRSEVINNQNLDHDKLIIPGKIKEHSASVYNRSDGS